MLILLGNISRCFISLNSQVEEQYITYNFQQISTLCKHVQKRTSLPGSLCLILHYISSVLTPHFQILTDKQCVELCLHPVMLSSTFKTWSMTSVYRNLRIHYCIYISEVHLIHTCIHKMGLNVYSKLGLIQVFRLVYFRSVVLEVSLCYVQRTVNVAVVSLFRRLHYHIRSALTQNFH